MEWIVPIAATALDAAAELAHKVADDHCVHPKCLAADRARGTASDAEADHGGRRPAIGIGLQLVDPEGRAE